MLFTSRTLFVAVLVLPVAVPLAAQAAPKTIKDVPVFAGAKVELDTESPSILDGKPGPMGETIQPRSGEFVVYEVAATPEAVLEFYKLRLRAIASGPVQWSDPPKLAPGTVSPVMWRHSAHDVTTEHTASGFKSSVKKATLARARKPIAPGEWIVDADFVWIVKEPNSDETEFEINLEDRGLSDDWEKYTPLTRFLIKRVTWPRELSDDERNDAASERMKREVASNAAALGNGPDEATLGVAIYPGAKFDARNSAGMSLGETARYFYLSNDEPAQVIKFYQTKMAKTPTDLGSDEHVFLIEGNMPFPQFAVFVKKNTVFAGPAKTVITVSKAK